MERGWREGRREWREGERDLCRQDTCNSSKVAPPSTHRLWRPRAAAGGTCRTNVNSGAQCCVCFLKTHYDLLHHFAQLAPPLFLLSFFSVCISPEGEGVHWSQLGSPPLSQILDLAQSITSSVSLLWFYIWGWALTSESVQSWRLNNNSAAPLGNQAASTMTWFPTQSYYPGTEPTQS